MVRHGLRSGGAMGAVCNKLAALDADDVFSFTTTRCVHGAA